MDLGLIRVGLRFCAAAAHAKGIAVGEIVGNILGIGEGDVRALPGQADVVAVIFEAMREKVGSGIFAATDYSEEHGISPDRNSERNATMSECDARRKSMRAVCCGNMEE